MSVRENLTISFSPLLLLLYNTTTWHIHCSIEMFIPNKGQQSAQQRLARSAYVCTTETPITDTPMYCTTPARLEGTVNNRGNIPFLPWEHSYFILIGSLNFLSQSARAAVTSKMLLLLLIKVGLYLTLIGSKKFREPIRMK